MEVFESDESLVESFIRDGLCESLSDQVGHPEDACNIKEATASNGTVLLFTIIVNLILLVLNYNALQLHVT